MAGRLDGSAVVSYETVAALTSVESLELSQGSGDAIDVQVPVDVFGETLVLAGTGRVVAGDVIEFRVQSLAPIDSSGLPQQAAPLVEQFVTSTSVDVRSLRCHTILRSTQCDLARAG
jgi:hypothetical protein